MSEARRRSTTKDEVDSANAPSTSAEPPPASLLPPHESHSHEPHRVKGSKFFNFIVGQTESTAQPTLIAWMDKPLPTVDPYLDKTYPTISYRDSSRRPPELRPGAILRSAKVYCQEERSAGRWKFSVVLAGVLTVVLCMPALLWCLLLSAYNAVLNRYHPTTPRDPASTASISVNSGLPTPATVPSTPAATKQQKSNYLNQGASLARTWALYLVFVIPVHLECSGGLFGFLVASTSPAFLRDLKEAREKGGKLVAEATEEGSRSERLYRHAAQWRREASQELETYCVQFAKDQPTDSVYKDAHYLRLEQTFHERLRLVHDCKQAIAHGEEDIEQIRAIAKSQPCANSTGYKGLADWASDAMDSNWGLTQVVSAICFLGAGLTYAAIFGAVRGDVGLMSWAFALFVSALALLVQVQALLLWVSRLQNYAFSVPLFFDVCVGASVYGACAAAFTAIMLLVVTVWRLKFDRESFGVAQRLASAAAGGDMSGLVPCPSGRYDAAMKVFNNGTTDLCNLVVFGGNFIPGDAHLTFELNPKYPAGITVFYVMGVLELVFLALGVYILVYGLDDLLWRRSTERKKIRRVQLDDLEIGGSWEKEMESMDSQAVVSAPTVRFGHSRLVASDATAVEIKTP